MDNKEYRLQVAISIELSEKLKRMAKEDDRTLRAFCKRILESYVDERESINAKQILIPNENELDNQISKNEITTINDNEPAKKKMKVGALIPK